eukprot:2155114-Amphidinium_carterae.1
MIGKTEPWGQKGRLAKGGCGASPACRHQLGMADGPSGDTPLHRCTLSLETRIVPNPYAKSQTLLPETVSRINYQDPRNTPKNRITNKKEHQT